MNDSNPISDYVAPELARLSNVLGFLQKDPTARPAYSIAADALFWSDEIPASPIGDDLLFRYLLRHRTAIIMEEEEKTGLQELWASANKAFPAWPGFSPERNQPTRELQAFCQFERDRSIADLEAGIS
jgi:hypothetical protein